MKTSREQRRLRNLRTVDAIGTGLQSGPKSFSQLVTLCSDQREVVSRLLREMLHCGIVRNIYLNNAGNHAYRPTSRILNCRLRGPRKLWFLEGFDIATWLSESGIVKKLPYFASNLKAQATCLFSNMGLTEEEGGSLASKIFVTKDDAEGQP